MGDSTQTKNNTIHRVKEIVRISNHGKEFEQLIETDNRFFWVSYVRARHESWNNQEDLNDDLDDLYSFFRVKLYLGAGYKPTKNTQLYARLVNESRFYGHKDTGDTLKNDHLWRPQRHYFELVFAQLFFEWKNIGQLPLSFKIRRQYLHNKGFGSGTSNGYIAVVGFSNFSFEWRQNIPYIRLYAAIGSRMISWNLESE